VVGFAYQPGTHHLIEASPYTAVAYNDAGGQHMLLRKSLSLRRMMIRDVRGVELVTARHRSAGGLALA
jgi:hypothetical protein